MEQFKHIRLDKLHPPEFDNRLTPSPDDDDDLRDSIRELGVLEPLLVKNIGDGYEIIFGHRRWIQAGRAGLAAVPCIVTKATGAMSEKMKIHENIKRLPLSHIDQGVTFAHLSKEYNMTESQIATLVGKSIAYVSQHLSLIHSDETIVAAVHDGRINFSVARELQLCKDADERNRFLKIVETSGATQYVVRNWVQESNRETESVSGSPQPPPVPGRPVEHSNPMYPCAACEVPTDILEIVTTRLCPQCHHLIFNAIDKEKQELRMRSTQKAAPDATG